jgi:hypothetical protein
MTWKHPHSPVKKKFKTVESLGKVMATVFWDVYGVLLVDFTRPGSTTYAGAYQVTLKGLKEAIRHKRPGLLTKALKSFSFTQQCLTSKCCRTVNLLNSWGWEILPHPPYSPDLALSDFNLFPKMRNHLTGQCFHSIEDVQNEVKKWLCAQVAFFFSMKGLIN